jgi:ankyrin repeat protein
MLLFFQNHLDVVKYLAERKVDIECSDRWGRTALHSAAWKNNFPLLQFLVEIGAQIESTDEVLYFTHFMANVQKTRPF